MFKSSITLDTSREKEEFPALQDLRAHREQRVQKDTTDQEEKEDHRDFQDPLEQLDSRVLRGHQGMEFMSDGVDFKDQVKRVQAPWPAVLSWNHRLCQETQDLAAPEESVAYQACLVKRVKKDLKGTLDLLDRLVSEVTADQPEDLENLVPLDRTGRGAPLDQSEQRETEVLTVSVE